MAALNKHALFGAVLVITGVEEDVVVVIKRNGIPKKGYVHRLTSEAFYLTPWTDVNFSSKFQFPYLAVL